MKDFKINVPNNTYTLSRADIAVIHALCLCSPDTMKEWADNVRVKLEKQFRFHGAIGNYKVWKE